MFLFRRWSKESAVRGSSTSLRTSGQSRLEPREFGEDASERVAFCTIQPYSPSLHHNRYIDCTVGAACTAPSPARLAGSRAQFDLATRFSSPGNLPSLKPFSRLRWQPYRARGDCCPPGKGCNRASPSSRDEAGVSQPLLHRTQERGSPTNPGSASLEPGFAQAHVQDADAQAHYQMHPAPGYVCSDQPEGRLHSCFDPSVTQTVPTVCVRGSGMAVQGPPSRPLPVSPCLYEGHRGRPYPLREVGVRVPNYLDDWPILAQSKEQLCDHRDLVLWHLSQLGHRVNWEKNKLSPVQRIFFRCGVRLVSEAPGAYDIRSCSHAARVASH